MPLLQIHEPGETPLPHEGSVAIGIDLGTTNSAVAVATKGKAEVIFDEQSRALLPSAVWYKDDTVKVGHEAHEQAKSGNPDSVTSIKRLMGVGGDAIKSISGTLPYALAKHSNNEGMVRLKVNNRERTPIEISADILKTLKHRAETSLEKTISKAVITVPAYFDDAARTATKDAAKLAGLEVLRLINEPTAAALAYGIDNAAEGTYAVYDLGGGTFDISLLKMQKGVFQVLATGGDAILGGDDFDHALAEHILKEQGIKKPSQKQLQQTIAQAKQIKEQLTDKEEIIIGSSLEREQEPPLSLGGGQRGLANEVSLVAVGGGQASNTEPGACPPPNLPPGGEGLSTSRTTFNTLITPIVDRTISACEQVLEDANLTPDDIKGVILVGGSTRVPLVREKVAEFFRQGPLTNLDPDLVVAYGAAIQAEGLTKGSDNLLLDVIPLSLGLETMGGIVEKIIHRNSTIPTAIAQEFTTYQDGQTGMQIHVVQGEREMVGDCRSLAHFELTGIPPMTAGAARIQITFAVDADGILTVTAREQTTGTEQKVEVKPTYGLSESAMMTMLRDSMTHAKEDMGERLLTEARVEAERSLLALDVALQKDGDLLEPQERKAIDKSAEKLRDTLKSSDRDAIQLAADKLEAIIQPFAQKRMDKGIGTALKGKEIEQIESELLAKKTEST